MIICGWCSHEMVVGEMYGTEVEGSLLNNVSFSGAKYLCKNCGNYVITMAVRPVDSGAKEKRKSAGRHMRKARAAKKVGRHASPAPVEEKPKEEGWNE